METERRIKSTGKGSGFYGNCERCGEPCVVVYKQQWRKQNATSRGWVDAGYGHQECLRTGLWENLSHE